MFLWGILQHAVLDHSGDEYEFIGMGRGGYQNSFYGNINLAFYHRNLARLSAMKFPYIMSYLEKALDLNWFIIVSVKHSVLADD